jgi:hypothetical protein
VNFKLPVSGTGILMRQPSGAEDLLLVEARVADAALAISLLSRVAQAADGSALDWESVPATDIDAALLRLRQIVFGDAIRADATCRVAGCGKRIDIAFGIDEYLEHHAPRPARGADPSAEAGWIRLRATPVSFRIPTGADQVAVAFARNPEHELVRRCIKPPDVAPALTRRVEKAMEALAPSLAHNLSGRCPECGTTIAVYFDPRQFVLCELREQADFIYEDTHLLAEHYHWPEADILALPRDRRLRYAEIVRRSRTAGWQRGAEV